MCRRKRVMGSMIDNLRPVISLNPYFLSLMRGSLFRMAMWAAVATIIYFVAFLTNGSHASDWINSYAIIVILLAYLATEIIIANIRKAKYKNVEWVPLVTEEGKVVGSAPRPLVHNGSHGYTLWYIFTFSAPTIASSFNFAPRRKRFNKASGIQRSVDTSQWARIFQMR